MQPDDILKDPFAGAFTRTTHNDTYPFISPAQFSLTGKYYVVTGASKGIGQAMVVSLARAGAAGIACLARTSMEGTIERAMAAAAAAEEETGRREKPQIIAVKCDTTSAQEVENAARQIEKAFGRLDVLVNNAGYLEEWLPLAETRVDDWWRSWEVNVKGCYLMDRALIPLLLRGGDKTIVTSSSAGGLVTSPGASAYQGTKAAVLRLNNHIMADYGEQGLLSFCIHPGGVLTELARNMPQYMHGYLNDTPELAADTLVWLTSEKRDWLADRYVSVSWDMSELEAKKDEIVARQLLQLKLRL